MFFLSLSALHLPRDSLRGRGDLSNVEVISERFPSHRFVWMMTRFQPQREGPSTDAKKSPSVVALLGVRINPLVLRSPSWIIR